MTEDRECSFLVTFYAGLLRLFAGGGGRRIVNVGIPEVLIGEVNFRVEHTHYTSLRRCAGFFLSVSSICNSNRQFTHIVAFPFIPLRFLTGEADG
ncbi:hypothetical protein [Citrobacter amalonaticus]|uniref:hypothetical protein n=1 Tax=Citrobacter amalonaticus TaxID=35703 RepID=UPI0015E16BE4|nr:hypothetical protein [Citrobacter amalonaticus]